MIVIVRKYLSPASFFIFVIMAALLLQGCASSKAASYHYTQKQIEHGDLNFHETVRIDEYLNAFPQEWLQVPEEQDIALRVDPFTSYQPQETDTTLIQIALKTRDATVSDMQKNVGICFVLDKSGSMRTENSIQHMIDAVTEAIMELNDGDEVAVIVFDNNAGVFIPVNRISGDSRDGILVKLNTLRAGGATNIQAGLVLGYKEMSKFTVDGPKRLLLITDGMSNVGVTSPSRLAEEAEVGYVQGARISTIGLGYGVEEDLLRRIAQDGSGHYYFAENSTYLKKILIQDLKSTLHPVAKDVRLTLSTIEGFKLLHVYGAGGVAASPDKDIPQTERNDGITVDIGEMNIDDWRILLAEVEGDVPPGEYQPISAKLTYTDIKSSSSVSMEGSASIAWHSGTPKSASPINPEVARNSVLYGNAAALIKVGELSSEEKYGSALEILDMQIQNNIIIRNEDNASFMDTEIDRLSTVRDIVLNASGAQPTGQPIQYEISGDKKSQLKDLAVEGAMASTEFLPGIWSTVAQILILLVI